MASVVTSCLLRVGTSSEVKEVAYEALKRVEGSKRSRKALPDRVFLIDLLVNLSRALCDEGRYEEAIPNLERAQTLLEVMGKEDLEKAADSKDAWGQVLSMLGSAYDGVGRCLESIRVDAMMSKAGILDAQGQTRMAKYIIDAEGYEQAIDFLCHAVEFMENHPTMKEVSRNHKSAEEQYTPFVLLADLLESHGSDGEEDKKEARRLRGLVDKWWEYQRSNWRELVEETRVLASEGTRQRRAGEREWVSNTTTKRKKKGRKRKRGSGGWRQSASSLTTGQQEQADVLDHDSVLSQALEEVAVSGKGENSHDGGGGGGTDANDDGLMVGDKEEDGEGDEEEEEEGGEEICSVCLFSLDADGDGDSPDGMKVLDCQHKFYNACLDIWKQKCEEEKLGFTCPYCRAHL